MGVITPLLTLIDSNPGYFSPGSRLHSSCHAEWAVACSYGATPSSYQATGASSGHDQEAPKTASLSLTVHVLRVQHYCAFH